MAKTDLIIRLAGESGEGVLSSGDILTQAAARSGYHVLTFRTFPAEIKGGHAWFQLRIDERPVQSIGDGLDVLVAFNDEGYYSHRDELRPDGILIYDPATVTPEPGTHQALGIPFTNISKRELDFPRGKNLVILGTIVELFGVDASSLEGVIRNRYKRRAELMDKNLASFEAGIDYARYRLEKDGVTRLRKVEQTGQRRLVLSGNDAIVAGALLAGCRFYAGYPITPASDIMEALARELPKVGGVMVQFEDETASITACIGASYAGKKVMTATSGPGLSLMTEAMGLASMAEIPLVICDVQRAGPSTGLPSKIEQSDLNHALYAGHGDFPRIVLAPGSVSDCFYQTITAFNLAEEYQMPVILLSDQSLGQRTETIDRPNLDRITVSNRLHPNGERSANGTAQPYRRFALTASGVSPMAVPGIAGTAYVAPGLEHDEFGHPKYDPKTHAAMHEKRFRKMRTLQATLPPMPRYGAVDAEIGMIGWGATEGAIREAVDLALEEGYRVAALHARILNPLPEQHLRHFIATVKHVIVPEMNYGGQFAHHLGGKLGFAPISFTKYGGLPFTPGEIYRKIREVANG